MAAGADASFTVTLNASTVALGQTRFGTITLTQTGAGNHRVLHMPVTIVRGQEAVTLTKTCDPTALKAKGTTTCTVTAANPTFDKVTYAIKDTLPSQLKLDKGSVTGGTTSGSDTVVSSGTIAASDPADVHAENCGACSPFGYFPLSNFPSTIVVGDAGDETIDNFTVPTFSFAGETWDSVGIVSDGYAVVGGGTGQDVEFINQVLAGRGSAEQRFGALLVRSQRHRHVRWPGEDQHPLRWPERVDRDRMDRRPRIQRPLPRPHHADLDRARQRRRSG